MWTHFMTIGASHMAIFGKRGKREGEKMWEKRKKREKRIRRENEFKDDLKRLDGLKTKRKSMQKLEESH